VRVGVRVLEKKGGMDGRVSVVWKGVLLGLGGGGEGGGVGGG
jgi:hypothetical protein